MRYRPTLTILMLMIAVILALPAGAQQKPFTQDQVQGMVRSGLGDESGAKLIDQRGVDFAPTEDFLQGLKAAGANEAFLKALRAAKAPEPASAKKPLNQVQVFALLAGGVPSHRVAMLVNERGIDFEPQQDYLDEVRMGGGDDELITALQTAKVTKPVTVDPAAQARQAEVRQHAARGAELAKKAEYAEAEQEYRAALLLDSQNADLYASLAYVLDRQNKWDDSASAAREALRLNPNDGLAHANLGVALEQKGDLRGALEEYRAAYTLDPKNATYKEEYESALRKQSAPEAPPAPTFSTQVSRPTGEVLASAKTLCIVQVNGSPVIKAEIEKKLLKWGQLTLVSSVNESDLVLVIAQTGQLNTLTGEGNQAAASLKDRQSGAVLWSTTKGGSWSYRGFSNAWVGRAMADELTKFFTSFTKGSKK